MWEIFKDLSGKAGNSVPSPGLVRKIGLVICILLPSFHHCKFFSVRIGGIREIKLLIFFSLSLKQGLSVLSSFHLPGPHCFTLCPIL